MPAKYNRKVSQVEAMQHDGSNDSALRIEAWVLGGGGDAVAILRGALDFAQENAFVKVNSTRSHVYVGPGGWVVHPGDKLFYPISREDFEILYEPALADISEATIENQVQETDE